MTSPRFVEILTLVCEGKTNKEIACDLHLSEKTVKNHLYIMFRQLKVANRTAAAIAAIRMGLVPLGRETQGAPERPEERSRSDESLRERSPEAVPLG